MTDDAKELISKYADFLSKYDRAELAYLCMVFMETAAEVESLSTNEIMSFVEMAMKERPAEEEFKCKP